VGEKATSGLRFNTRPLTESQIGDDRRYWIYRKTQRTTVTGTVDLRMGSIRVVEGIGVWIFRQKSCGVNVHASIFPESRRRRLQTP